MNCAIGKKSFINIIYENQETSEANIFFHFFFHIFSLAERFLKINSIHHLANELISFFCNRINNYCVSINGLGGYLMWFVIQFIHAIKQQA